MSKKHAPTDGQNNKHPLSVSHNQQWLILVILLVGFCLRLWRITNPVLDWHAFRQADTASVTREFVKNGVDFLHPKYHDLSNIQSGKDNLAGYRMVEFPIANGIIATLIRLFPRLPIDVTSRVISVIVSCGTLVIFYDVIRRLFSARIATATMAVMAVLPYAVYYSRVILPEPFLLFFAITSIWCFVKYHADPNWSSLFSFTCAFAFALLLKPFVIFYVPLFLAIHYLWWRESAVRQKIRHTVLLGLAAGASLIPFWWWRKWIQQFPSGIPAADWLFNSNGIRWRPAWFRWLGYERFTKLMLGYGGIIFVIANVLSKISREWILLLAWWLGILVYLSVIATGNVQHDYYQVLTIPLVCLTVGRGVIALYDFLYPKMGTRQAMSIVALISLVGWSFAGNQVRGYFNVNHWEYVRAGEAVSRLTDNNAKVIAPAFGDTMFLYQTNRTGWPIGFEIEQKRKLGATHYVTTSYDDEARELEKKYLTLEKTPEYLLLDLTIPIGTPSTTKKP